MADWQKFVLAITETTTRIEVVLAPTLKDALRKVKPARITSQSIDGAPLAHLSSDLTAQEAAPPLKPNEVLGQSHPVQHDDLGAQARYGIYVEIARADRTFAVPADDVDPWRYGITLDSLRPFVGQHAVKGFALKVGWAAKCHTQTYWTAPCASETQALREAVRLRGLEQRQASERLEAVGGLDKFLSRGAEAGA